MVVTPVSLPAEVARARFVLTRTERVFTVSTAHGLSRRPRLRLHRERGWSLMNRQRCMKKVDIDNEPYYYSYYNNCYNHGCTLVPLLLRFLLSATLCLSLIHVVLDRREGWCRDDRTKVAAFSALPANDDTLFLLIPCIPFLQFSPSSVGTRCFLKRKTQFPGCSDAVFVSQCFQITRLMSHKEDRNPPLPAAR